MAQVISNAELTQGALTGTGTFDVMMAAVKAHIEQEYEDGRIKGAEYAQVYLGAVTAVMQNATQFLIGQLNAEDNALLIQAQIAKVNAEKLLVDKQLDKVLAEIALAEQQKTNLIAENANIPKQGQLLDAQTSKATSEKNLLDQKLFTEEAQIKDTVDGAAVVGVVGKQKELYTAQTDGFARDAEQKVAKMVTEVFSVLRTSDDTLVVPSSLNETSINAIVNKAKAGIGA
ncbi:MAG: hypothetical protein ACRBB6_04200 [Neptuniibacter sp.]